METILSTYREVIDARLFELLPHESVVPSELHGAMRYSVLSGGKRLRPALLMACAEIFAERTSAVVDAACAVELVHCFSLIHDDLPAIDNDDLRRGMPTCHKKYGDAVAILAGDAIFALAFQTLGNLNEDSRSVATAVAILAGASGSLGLAGGETIDVLSEGTSVSPETLEFIHAKKTGALISASCEIGAVMADAPYEDRHALRRYGEHVGLAFQIADDILNETSTPEQLGKSAGSDRARQKATYPTVHGLDKSLEASKEAVARAKDELDRFESKADRLRLLADFAVERIR